MGDAMTSTCRRGLIIVVVICLLCAIGSCILAGLEAISWQRLGSRLGIAPTRVALDEYLHAVMRPGMSLEQVHKELDLIAPNTIRPLVTGGPRACEEVVFLIG